MSGSSRLRRAVVALAVSTSLGSLLVACSGGDSPSPQESAAQKFLDALGRADASGAAALTDDEVQARASISADLTGLGSGVKGTLKVGKVTTKGDGATAGFTASWALPGVSTPWRYDGSLPLHDGPDGWQVTWRASDVHPKLTATTHLALDRTQPTRAGLLDAAGTPLFARTPVVEVGIEPSLVKNLPSLARSLAAVPQLQSTAAEITAAVKAAKPNAFVPVITLRRSVYEPIRNRIRPLDGTVFHESTALLTPSAHYGQPLLGTVGPVTADAVKAGKGRVAVGDSTGLGGLQQVFDATLAGTAGVSVVAADADGTSTATLAAVSKPKAGKDVRTTVDRTTQTAAEKALAGISQQASIVAVNRRTGAVLADANTTAATYDLGLAGAVPAGSTFKIATWVAAFTADPKLTASSKVDCPATITVDGRVFENEDKFHYPPIPISSAFGYSCNTSAIDEALSLPTGSLATSAKALGLGATWSLPVDSFSGSLPAPATQTERAADAIGQGRVQVSPLLMALMAGAATTGTPVLPSLEAGSRTRTGAALPATIVAKMTALMKATVQLEHGTGHALTDLPGVEGKTGTAEYGNDTPPRSHAWFAGVQGDVAFAVFVYDGASAHIDPAVVSHRFLAALS